MNKQDRCDVIMLKWQGNDMLEWVNQLGDWVIRERVALGSNDTSTDLRHAITHAIVGWTKYNE